ncbi:MAG: putative toxin-antitoxin system toxin component, PIN family [Deltaproteobacteria bacterium]|nr:putative toxin-antitoxin system toxin component, PIN family [Deltaproteobacteria bacterium]
MISGLLFTGEASRIVRLWQEQKIIPVISRDTFDELRAVLHYPKFALNAQEILNLIESENLPYFEVIDIVQKFQGVCQDPGDDEFIACAISARVDCIATGDHDLADLKKYKNIRILRISDFLRLFN